MWYASHSASQPPQANAPITAPASSNSKRGFCRIGQSGFRQLERAERLLQELRQLGWPDDLALVRLVGEPEVALGEGFGRWAPMLGLAAPVESHELRVGQDTLDLFSPEIAQSDHSVQQGLRRNSKLAGQLDDVDVPDRSVVDPGVPVAQQRIGREQQDGGEPIGEAFQALVPIRFSAWRSIPRPGCLYRIPGDQVEQLVGEAEVPSPGRFR